MFGKYIIRRAHGKRSFRRFAQALEDSGSSLSIPESVLQGGLGFEDCQCRCLGREVGFEPGKGARLLYLHLFSRGPRKFFVFLSSEEAVDCPQCLGVLAAAEGFDADYWGRWLTACSAGRLYEVVEATYLGPREIAGGFLDAHEAFSWLAREMPDALKETEVDPAMCAWSANDREPSAGDVLELAF